MKLTVLGSGYPVGLELADGEWTYTGTADLATAMQRTVLLARMCDFGMSVMQKRAPMANARTEDDFWQDMFLRILSNPPDLPIETDLDEERAARGLGGHPGDSAGKKEKKKVTWEKTVNRELSLPVQRWIRMVIWRRRVNAREAEILHLIILKENYRTTEWLMSGQGTEDPADIVIRREEEQENIGQMRSEGGEVAVLLYCGYKPREIAQYLGISPNAARLRIWKFRKAYLAARK